MQRHGGGPTRPAGQAAQVTVLGLPKGYRHYRLKDRDKPEPVSDQTTVSARAARLEIRMTAPLTWSPAPASLAGAEAPVAKQTPDPHDNPYVPSGYTYLAQFVAHDTVSTRVPFWATNRLDRDTSNDRANRLQLDALYGGGPTENPIIYAPADANDLSRGKLQIGRSGPIKKPDGTAICPFRDIARLKLSNTISDLPGLTEALVADPRNDDHALISQLTMVFSHLHNIFVDRQKAVDADNPAPSFTHDTLVLFANARAATTLIYRRIIRDDLLKHLLHPDVYALYNTDTPPALDQYAGDDRQGVPVEFSHAAFRFGHAMVRESYQINDVPPGTKLFLTDGLSRFSSSRNIHMQPMQNTWIVRWSNFFNMPQTVPGSINLSRRIGPRTPMSLFGQEFSAIDPTPGQGLFYRDLISAELANLWTVNDLLAAMRRDPALGRIIESSPFLRDGTWQAAIKTWLPQGDFSGAAPPWANVPDAVKQEDFNALATEPPLPFFILFEAEQDPEALGCCLGRFGSILVADTLFNELRNKTDAERTPGALNDQLRALHPAFADDAFAEPLTMAAVIGFVDACLQKSTNEAMRFPPLP